MVVMALEAATQMAEENSCIAGYIIKNATFTSALVIPTETGYVETETFLRPFNNSDKNSLKSEFKVCSEINGTWIENCRGTIQVQYKPAETEVHAGREDASRLCHLKQTFESGSTACRTRVIADDMYKHLDSMGLSYGPAFQSMYDLSYNHTDIAVGKVRPFEWIASEKSHPQPHIIHPATLDASLQLIMVALLRGTEQVMPTMMPTRIGKLWLSNKGINFSSTPTVSAYAKAAFSRYRTADTTVIVLNPETSAPLLSIENLEATAVAKHNSTPVDNENATKKCCNIAWKPDINLLSIQELLTYCESARPGRPSKADFYEDIGYAILMTASDVLEELIRVPPKVIQPHLTRYIQWLHHQIERFHAGTLPFLPNDHYKWIALQHDPSFREDLLERLESTNQGKFFLKVGRNLLQMITGDLDPLAFMFQDNAVPEFYNEITCQVLCYEPLDKYLGTLYHDNPGLKVIEIGAGTGAATEFFLNALSSTGSEEYAVLNCAHYDYTDISPAFLEAATKRFASHAQKVSFGVLNIESDPTTQGFEAGTYDLVFAAAVMYSIPYVITELTLLYVKGSSRYQKLRHNRL
jgi:hypothetical protein